MNFLKLIRWPNLIIIVLTQVLLRHCVFRTFLPVKEYGFALDELYFILLVLASILIAAAGNIINDIFDQDIDQYNKPGENLVGRVFSEKKAWLFYYLFNAIGMAAGIFVSLQVRFFWLALVFPVIILVLRDYSVRYKRRPFIGNIVVSLLSALVIIIIWLFELFAQISKPVNFASSLNGISIIHIFVLFYALFAFLASFMREITKDVADAEGDLKGNCRTIPLVYGETYARKLLLVLAGACFALLVFAQVLLLGHHFRMVFWYLLIAVDTLLIYFGYDLLYGENSRENYAFRSNMMKLFMVAGILSMQILYINR